MHLSFSGHPLRYYWLWSDIRRLPMSTGTLFHTFTCLVNYQWTCRRQFWYTRNVWRGYWRNNGNSINGELSLGDQVFSSKLMRAYLNIRPSIRGRGPTREQWVFGLADTSTHPCTVYMQHNVEDRKATTLIPIIESVVRKGSIIHSDQWAAYRQLHQHPDFTYESVNHSEYFVDPATGVHTQVFEY